MNKFNYSIAAIAGGLSLSLGGIATAEENVCDMKILNRPGCEVGDFGPRKNAHEIQIIDAKQQAMINRVREAWPPPSSGTNPPSGESIRQRKAYQDVIRGDSYAKANDFIQAVQCYQDAVTLVPDEAKFHFMLACAAWNAKDIELASEQYSKAIQLNSNFAEAYFGLALCKEKIKEPNAAIAALKECVRLKPSFSNGVGWLHLGKAYELVSDDVNAEKAYDMCLSSSQVSAYVIDEAKACLQKLKHKSKN